MQDVTQIQVNIFIEGLKINTVLIILFKFILKLNFYLFLQLMFCKLMTFGWDEKLSLCI